MPFFASHGAGLLQDGRGCDGVKGPKGDEEIWSVDPADGDTIVVSEEIFASSPFEQFFVEPPVPSPIWNTMRRWRGRKGKEKGVRMIKKNQKHRVEENIWKKRE